MVKVRDLSFDLVKGFLIIFVITGHILPGSANEGIRGAIYYFHMPLFLGITGYFVRKKIIDLGWLNIIKKYQRRMLVPYFIAFIVYSCYSLYTSMANEPISIKMIVRIIMYPYYHLWYIPAVILFIFYTKVAYKNSTSLVIFYILSSIITIVWYGFGNELEERYQFLKLVGDKRFYYYSSFFTLGFIISNLDIHINKVISFSVALGSALFGLFFEGNPLINSILWYAFNTFLVIFVISGCRDIKTPKTGFIVNIGQVSLPIYLWHVLPIITASCFFERKTIYYYLVVSFSMIMLCLFFVVSRGKNKFIDIYFHGNEPVPKNINNPKTLG